MITNQELSILMHAFMDMHKASQKIIDVMKEKEWMDSDCAEDINPSDEFERDVWNWTDATAYPGHDLLNCEDMAGRIFRQLKERGAAIE
jgi:hypothetical protein